MKTITVEIPGRSYDILVAEGLLSDPGPWLTSLTGLAEPGQAIAVVSDKNVWGHYGQMFGAGLEKAGLSWQPIVLPAGEDNKSLGGLDHLYQNFAAMGLKRGGLIIALGGGVIGDLAGFAAATWMRGVPYVQVPTSLLAQVDSSVGGKTAINIAAGKNLVGAFYQPRLVAIDPTALATLPPREIGCGLAEVIKYGAIRSAALFDKLEDGPATDFGSLIETSCTIKAAIVSRDELDTGERELLNFGHSFGHGLEIFYNYKKFNHGEAVAVGMVIAALIGETLGLTEPGTAKRIRRVLEINHLPTDSPCHPRELLPFLAVDKKGAGQGLRLVLLKAIGESFSHPITFKELEVLTANLAGCSQDMK